jgi:hypothetical protein
VSTHLLFSWGYGDFYLFSLSIRNSLFPASAKQPRGLVFVPELKAPPYKPAAFSGGGLNEVRGESPRRSTFEHHGWDTRKILELDPNQIQN